MYTGFMPDQSGRSGIHEFADADVSETDCTVINSIHIWIYSLHGMNNKEVTTTKRNVTWHDVPH